MVYACVVLCMHVLTGMGLYSVLYVCINWYMAL